MSSRTDVAIVGAGPYGMSIASHLAGRGVSFRIFGKPMESWLTQMPRDMQLKSEGFASSLYDPADRLSLGSYCRERGLRYADLGLPVPLQIFCDYGLSFQRRAVPMLARRADGRYVRWSGYRVGTGSGEGSSRLAWDAALSTQEMAHGNEG